jgi:hypothetical protein
VARVRRESERGTPRPGGPSALFGRLSVSEPVRLTLMVGTPPQPPRSNQPDREQIERAAEAIAQLFRGVRRLLRNASALRWQRE